MALRTFLAGAACSPRFDRVRVARRARRQCRPLALFAVAIRLDFDDELEYVFRTGVQLQTLAIHRDAGADFFVDHGFRGRVPAGGARFALEDSGGVADGVTTKKPDMDATVLGCMLIRSVQV